MVVQIFAGVPLGGGIKCRSMTNDDALARNAFEYLQMIYIDRN